MTAESKPGHHNEPRSNPPLHSPQCISVHFLDTQEIEFEGPRRRTYPTPSFIAQDINNSLDIGIASGPTFDS
jgi:hypothetical protein